ncbi:MAG: Lsr2 family protein [Actinomycetales bacterium]|jgi:hypothetical protein
MAQKVNIILVDDIDAGPADETVRFGLDGASYEIDLSETNAAALRSALERYIGAGRKSAAGRPVRGRPAAKTQDVAAIRSWARDNGYQVSSRGRIQSEIVEAFHAAKGA